MKQDDITATLELLDFHHRPQVILFQQGNQAICVGFTGLAGLAGLSGLTTLLCLASLNTLTGLTFYALCFHSVSLFVKGKRLFNKLVKVGGKSNGGDSGSHCCIGRIGRIGRICRVARIGRGTS